LTSHLIQVCNYGKNMTKLLQNLSTLYLSNTVQIDSTQLGPSTQDSITSQPVEQLEINTTEKLGIATQLVGMLGAVATHDKVSEALATPDRGLVAVANSSNLSGAIMSPHTNSKRSVNDAVLDAMKKQFYKV
jgi:hypothetical protein